MRQKCLRTYFLYRLTWSVYRKCSNIFNERGTYESFTLAVRRRDDYILARASDDRTDLSHFFGQERVIGILYQVLFLYLIVLAPVEYLSLQFFLKVRLLLILFELSPHLDALRSYVAASALHFLPSLRHEN